MSTFEILMNLWSRCHWPDQPGLRLMSLRGCKLVGDQLQLVPERIDRFDDLMCLIDPAKGVLATMPCTAGQPGMAWIKKYPEGQGAPFTRAGCYSYMRGVHLGKHRCLVQSSSAAGILAVIRDVNKNGVAEFAPSSPDLFDYPHNTGIHIHACTGTPSLVGLWSSGCHVVDGDWDKQPWLSLDQFVYATYAGQQSFWYGVCEGSWINDNSKRVLWGSCGSATSGMVAFLKTKGIFSFADCELFHESIDRGYRQWQRQSGQVQSGISVNPPWVIGG